MTNPYLELVQMTELYLLSEHQLSDRIYSDPTTVAFFRELAKPQAPKHQPITPPESSMPKIEPPIPKPTPEIPSSYSDLTEMGSLINQLYPQLQTNTTIPTYIPNLQAVTLIGLADEPHRSMLQNINNAIESKLHRKTALCSTLEVQWDKLLSNPDLLLIIVSRETLNKFEQLKGNKQLIIMENLDDLSAQPELKKQLWNQIKTGLQDSSN